MLNLFPAGPYPAPQRPVLTRAEEDAVCDNNAGIPRGHGQVGGDIVERPAPTAQHPAVFALDLRRIGRAFVHNCLTQRAAADPRASLSIVRVDKVEVHNMGRDAGSSELVGTQVNDSVVNAHVADAVKRKRFQKHAVAVNVGSVRSAHVRVARVDAGRRA